jgi:ankyrin repeat protein
MKRHAVATSSWVKAVFSAVLLCLSGAAIAQATGSGESPIMVAIRNDDLEGLKRLVEAQPSLVDREDARGVTPLMQAAYLERRTMVEYLRSRRTTLNVFESCIVGDLDRLKRFLAQGIDVDQRSPDGFPLLGLAVFFRQHEAARLLIDAGADVNARSRNTFNVAPIHGAVARGDVDTLELLLLKGADPDMAQQRWLKPMHEAAASGSLRIVALLLMFGADPAAVTEDGRAPADFAKAGGHAALAELLRKRAISRP